MERMTSRNEDCVLVNGHGLYLLMPHEIAQMAERLASYEDIAELCGGLVRLQELAEADKDGRCVVLPPEEKALDPSVKYTEICALYHFASILGSNAR